MTLNVYFETNIAFVQNITLRAAITYSEGRRDEIILFIHPSIPSSVPSSIQTEQIYILKREKTRKKIKTEKHFNR